jgi:putative tryptophan/tyrosine transport system substrate-binding protein
MTSRRDALMVIGAAAFASRASAQASAKRPHISVLLPGSPDNSGHLVEAFRRGLLEHGYDEKHNIGIEVHWLHGDLSRLPDVAAAIVRKGPDLIVVSSTPIALALKRATQTLPIVMGNGGGPVEAGLVASLSRPGGNVTGMSSMTEGLIRKHVELLLEIAPAIRRVGAVRRIKDPLADEFQRDAESAARGRGMSIQPLMLGGEQDIERLPSMTDGQRIDALIVFPDPVFVAARERIVKVVGGMRVPAIYPFREYAFAGGLVSYGVNIAENFRKASTYVHRILNGAKPADLPIQQPTRFELVLNQAAAQAVGLKVPESLRLRADELIE